jgi:hypothetical protein
VPVNAPSIYVAPNRNLWCNCIGHESSRFYSLTKLEPSEPALLTAYGLRNGQGALKVAVFNKNLDRAIRLTIDAGQRVQRVRSLRLHAPRVDDTADTTLGGSPVGAGGAWSAAREEMLRIENGAAVIELPPARLP